jgi:hypothetical protein
MSDQGCFPIRDFEDEFEDEDEQEAQPVVAKSFIWDIGN